MNQKRYNHMRAIWSGSISFGLVNIPVKLYSASDTTKLRFTLLAKPDFSKVQYKKVAETDGRELNQDDIVKGYEFSKGQFVVVDEKDLRKVDRVATSTIEIECFVSEKEIAPYFYKKPYYLEPESPSSKPYALLREALVKSGKVGIARFILRNKEHIGALKAYENMLVLNQMRYKNDMRNPDKLNLPDTSMKIATAELKIAGSIIDELSTSFDPGDYEDTYTEKLKELIEKKAEGKVVKSEGKQVRKTETDDLMKALKESLRESKSRGADKKGKKGERKES